MIWILLQLLNMLFHLLVGILIQQNPDIFQPLAERSQCRAWPKTPYKLSFNRMSALIPELLLFSHLFMAWDIAHKRLSGGFRRLRCCQARIAAGGRSWPNMPAGLAPSGAVGMQLGGTDDWHESNRAEMAETPARQGGRRPERRLRLRSSGIVGDSS